MKIDKSNARKAAFAWRKSVFNTGLDPAAQIALRAALEPFQGKPLSGFMPIQTEIDPLPVMADWAAPVGVPVIQGKDQPLIFHRWTPDTDMIPGPFGAKIPANPEIIIPEILIVPLLAFDTKGNRLGYGGGFYDRTLELLRSRYKTIAIGFAFSAQKMDNLPLEPTDQPLDAIVTELGIMHFT